MRTIIGCVLALAACTESGESPQVQVTLDTSDVRVVSVPAALDCGNGATACSSELPAEFTLVVVEHPDTCAIFTFQQAGIGFASSTEQPMRRFSAQPGEAVDIAISCGPLH